MGVVSRNESNIHIYIHIREPSSHYVVKSAAKPETYFILTWFLSKIWIFNLEFDHGLDYCLSFLYIFGICTPFLGGW